jgi:serine protease Do
MSAAKEVLGALGGSVRRNVEDWFQRRDFEYVRTDGTVSRVVSEEQGRSWLQHTAAVNPGNSGGPLVAENGTVVGINTQRPLGSQGIFYALTLQQLKQEINEHVRRPAWE